MRTLKMTLLMGLVAIGAEPAAAQRTGTFEVGAMGQFTRLDADVQLGDSSFGLGGRIGFFPLRHVAVEAEYGFGTLQDNPRNASTWLPFRAMMVLNLPITAGVKLLAGAGYKGERWHGDTTYNQIEDAYTFLGGLRVCLDGGWSLRPEVVLDHNGYSNNQGVGDNSNYVGFRFGVSRFLGRGSRTCASAPPPPPSPQAVAVTPASVSPPTPTSPTPSPVAPAPAPAPAPPPPPRELFRLDGVYFAFDRAEIRPEGLRLLDSAVATLDQNGTLRVEIQGHTDPVGSDAYNQDLSLRRANAVREYLVSRGIAASRMTTRGFGEDQPIADNATSDGRAQNRRVVVIEVPN